MKRLGILPRTSPSRRSTRTLAAAGLLATLAAVLAPVAPATSAGADANMTPDYEVKLLLTPSTLDAGHNPGSALRGYLGVAGGDGGERRDYQYLDTSDQKLDAAGWSVRERRIEKSGPLQLDFKHRWPIANGDITAALNQANADGFDASDTNYDAQVDWGYTKQTLSIATDKTHSSSDFSGTLPGTKAVPIALQEIPGKLDDWKTAGWGSQVLGASRVHGPVTSRVYDGSLDGHDADIEVLPIKNAAGTGTDYLVELSWKTDSQSQAASQRASAISELDAQGWLVHGDSLKTSLILDRY